MVQSIFALRELPRYEAIQAQAKRYPDIDPDAVAAYLVLVRVAAEMLERGARYLAGYRMSRGRFVVLMILNRDPERALCPVELARTSGVTRATMTGLLAGLERDGLVSKEAAADDRRMLSVRLTAKARRLLDRLLPGYYRQIAAAMRPLSEGQKKQLVGLLGQLGQTLEGAGVPASDGRSVL